MHHIWEYREAIRKQILINFNAKIQSKDKIFKFALTVVDRKKMPILHSNSNISHFCC